MAPARSSVEYMCKCRGTTDGKNVMVKIKGSTGCHHITATSVETSLIVSVEKPLNGVKADTVLCFITFTLLISHFTLIHRGVKRSSKEM